MPRVHVKKARKSKKVRKCGECQHEIQPGEMYKYARQRVGYPRFGTVVRYWCADHYPGRYEFIQSAKRRALAEATDTLDEALAGDFDMDTATDVFESAASDVEDIAEMHRESAQNIEDGFGHPTSQSEEFNEKADQVEQAAESLRSADFPPEPESPDPDDEEWTERWIEEDADRKWEEWRNEVRELASELMGEVEV